MSSARLVPHEPQLRVAAAQFAVAPDAAAEADSRTRAKVLEVVEPLETTVLLLDDGHTRLCLITSHFGWTTPVNVCDLFREAIARDLKLPKSHVLLCSSHNHCCVAFASNATHAYRSYGFDAPPAELLPIGEQFLAALRACAQTLPERLEPVSVWWAQGHEERITYNRKGLREDGSSYLMREEDRQLLGTDFRGDIDPQAPVVVFKNTSGKAVAALAQFTGHPVTAYHPERPIVFGEWPQVACHRLADALGQPGAVPVGFLQGCAGNVNSKEMFVGGVSRSTEFGHLLGQSYMDALPQLQPSQRDGLEFAVEKVHLPLAPLPPRDVLAKELRAMDDFIARARAGDDDTRFCAGQNFPQALTPAFRANLVEMIRAWNVWGLDLYEQGRQNDVAKHLSMEIAVLRLGDVGIVAMPCEPFQGIGRQIRDRSPLPITIPCGYANESHGYIPDSANLGGQEYMSAHHRYTRFRPPLAPPAGDVLADRAVSILGRLAKETAHQR